MNGLPLENNAACNTSSRARETKALAEVWGCVALKGAYALPMTKSERNVFRTIAGREPPRKPVRECWFVIGRRPTAGSRSISLSISYVMAEPATTLTKSRRIGVLMSLAADDARTKAQLSGLRDGLARFYASYRQCNSPSRAKRAD
jgi:hypothetical protein